MLIDILNLHFARYEIIQKENRADKQIIKAFSNEKAAVQFAKILISKKENLKLNRHSK